MLLDRSNGLQLVRQVLGRQANDLIQRRQEVWGYQVRLAVIGSAVHHAVAHAVERLAGKPAFQPFEQGRQCRVVVGKLGMFVNQGFAAGVADLKMAAAKADPLHAARQDAVFLLAPSGTESTSGLKSRC